MYTAAALLLFTADYMPSGVSPAPSSSCTPLVMLLMIAFSEQFFP